MILKAIMFKKKINKALVLSYDDSIENTRDRLLRKKLSFEVNGNPSRLENIVTKIFFSDFEVIRL